MHVQPTTASIHDAHPSLLTRVKSRTPSLSRLSLACSPLSAAATIRCACGRSGYTGARASAAPEPFNLSALDDAPLREAQSVLIFILHCELSAHHPLVQKVTFETMTENYALQYQRLPGLRKAICDILHQNHPGMRQKRYFVWRVIVKVRQHFTDSEPPHAPLRARKGLHHSCMRMWKLLVVRLTPGDAGRITISRRCLFTDNLGINSFRPTSHPSSSLIAT